MPTYEYECRQCRHRFEAVQSMREAPLDRCPRCGGEVRRLISGGGGFIIKGGGGGGDRPSSGGCALEETGHTCCGRAERCGKPPCGGDA
jgi:putative FmdB family regulatory protein